MACEQMSTSFQPNSEEHPLRTEEVIPVSKAEPGAAMRPLHNVLATSVYKPNPSWLARRQGFQEMRNRAQIFRHHIAVETRGAVLRLDHQTIRCLAAP